MNNAVAKTKRRPSSRQAILEAAAHLVAEAGASHLTLEAVAARAGVSKGGLLYNFPNKQALLTAMIEQAVAEATALLETKKDEDGPPPEDIIRAIFDQRFAWLCDAVKDRTAHGMLAAMAENPAMLDPIRRLHELTWARMKAVSADAPALWLIWLAGEGLLFADLYQVSPLSAAERAQMIKCLRAEADRLLAGESCAGKAS